VDRLLEGKTSIITGSGRGIGRAAAELMARHGARVVVSDIDPAPAEEALGAILAAGGEGLSVPGDVTDREFPGRIVRAAVEKFGGLDIIVNNAGYTWDGVIHKMTDEQWEAILAVHLTAPFRIIRAASEFLRETAKREKSESGRARARKIVNISSTSGTRGNAGQSNYSSGKAGVIGLTKTLSLELGEHNITVNCICPSTVDSGTNRGLAMRHNMDWEELAKDWIKDQSMQEQLVEKIDIANAVLFLASDEARFITGVALPVDAGICAK
jgi:3-oxoacyl-[acyl-carrier protein] reductase